MRVLVSTLLLLTFTQGQLLAQADTAHHREVYDQINGKLKSLKKVNATYKEDEALEFQLEAYKDGSQIVRIDSSVPGEDGDGSEEYYLEDGKLLFAFRYYKSMSAEANAKPVTVEDRFYFKDGALFKWIGTDKKLVSKEEPEFAIESERIATNLASFLAALDKKQAPTGVVQTTTGSFKGIEQGDYGHWNMTDAAGKELSFFILQPDASVDKVLEDAVPFVGKSCEIQWKKSKEDIPEAGGAMMIEQILSVKWLE